NLWLALDNGISMVPISVPVSFYNGKAGLETTLESIARFNNYLYVATRTGTYYLTHPGGLNIPPTFSEQSYYNKPEFLQVDEVTSECWGLLPLELGKQRCLFIALNSKVYIIDENNRIIDKIDNIPYSFWQSEQDPYTVFIGTETGIESITLKNGNWIRETKIKGIDELIYSIIEDPSGNLWMTTDNGSVYVMNITNYRMTKKNPKVFRYDTTHGLPEGDIYVELVNEKPLFATTKGLYTFLPDQERFEPDTLFGAEFADGSRDIYKLLQDPEKNIWMVTYFPATEEFETGFLQLTKNGNYEWIKEPFLSFSKEVIHALHHDKDGITWMGGPEGLFRFDPDMEKDYEQEYNTLIRKVTLGQDSIIFFGTYYDNNSLPAIIQPETLIPVLPYKYNSLVFEFSAPVNEDNSPMVFSYWLEGYEKDWSDWSTDTKKEYTNLHEDSYKFHVRSKNLYEKIGNQSTYEFLITPPWTRTILAYIGYILFLAGFIYAVVTIYTRNLRAIIRDRTAEIREKKEEIEEKNKDIMDSIQYAQRIQEALLTPGDYVEKLFPERFILFLPRDIVSGDYYWMTEKNNKIICVTADCTGHGVPGAFMSMLGMAFLNEIISKRKSIHANEILNDLRAMVISSLRQTGQTGENQDGMDLALYILDQENMKLEYAGANNPLFLYRNNELFITKADKMPIGISSLADEPFTNHIIDLQKGDLLYTFSDGYPDQFGGPKGKKFMIKNFKQLLSENLHKPMDEQKKVLEETLNEWMANTEQVDDILVIGVKV
ncbi:MAG: SpoIIE family protein phosphatase, partial [Bacteroidales bacterium]|nr:SpoIIE family protein phosphatase [Bacteroidales bacterium]